MISTKVKFENNAPTAVKDLETKKELILFAIGLKWQTICTKIITINGIVDTGRLRGSLTFITKSWVGGPIASVGENVDNDYLGGSSGSDDVLIVGSNVEYAAKNEFNNPKGAFLRPSVTEYSEDYKNIAEEILKRE